LADQSGLYSGLRRSISCASQRAIAPSDRAEPKTRRNGSEHRRRPMKTMILAAAAVIALGVGVAGSAFAEGEGGSATGAVQWRQADGSTVPATEFQAQYPTARQQ